VAEGQTSERDDPGSNHVRWVTFCFSVSLSKTQTFTMNGHVRFWQSYIFLGNFWVLPLVGDISPWRVNWLGQKAWQTLITYFIWHPGDLIALDFYDIRHVSNWRGVAGEHTTPSCSSTEILPHNHPTEGQRGLVKVFAQWSEHCGMDIHHGPPPHLWPWASPDHFTLLFLVLWDVKLIPCTWVSMPGQAKILNF
jgi:hypothetical protein